MTFRCAAFIAAALLILPLTQADEAAIRDQLTRYFRAADRTTRHACIAAIENDSDYQRARLSTWLHRLPLWKPAADALHVAPADGRVLRGDLPVPIDADYDLRIAVRLPAAYDPDRPWPLIYALHGTGGRGEDIITYVEQLLGDRVNDYIVAAPDQYRQVIVYATEPATDEHIQALIALRKALHIDSDRIFATGYSRGGHACWTLAVRHPDQFAAILPVAGTFILQEYEQLWPTFLPNLAHTYVVCAWGAADTAASDSRRDSPDGGIAGMNRLLGTLTTDAGLPVRMYEHPDLGHGGVRPPDELLTLALARRRRHYPNHIEHTFRDLTGGHAYWLRADEWTGPSLDDGQLQLRFLRGEDPRDPAAQRAAIVRAIRARLARIEGDANGNHLDVSRSHVKRLTVWLSDDLIDFAQPVRLEVSGHDRFNDRVPPSLAVALAEAARTYDFDRLRWAGLVYQAGRKVELVTAEE